MKEEHQAAIDYLSNLLNESEMVDADERQYWKDLLPEMTEDQIIRLFRILTLDNKEELIEFNKLLLIEYGKETN